MRMLLDAALEIQSVLESHGWRYCFIGGLAVARWGEPRFTRDVDCTLLTGFGDEQRYVATLLARFTPRIEDAGAFAAANRVLLVTTSNGIPADLALGGLPYEELCVDRASYFDFQAGYGIRICSAEDLVVLKAFAARDQDWLDIRGILIRQKGLLDWTYILDQLSPLAELKEDPAILQRLTRLRSSEDDLARAQRNE